MKRYNTVNPITGKENLLSVNADAKTKKGTKSGYLTGVLYLAPSDESGLYNTCPMSTNGCRNACLFTAGRARFDDRINAARIRKTVQFYQYRADFMLCLEKNIKALIRKADRENLVPCVRLNGTSDIKWEKIGFTDSYGKEYRNLMERFPNVQFYDYTKIPVRKNLPSNYHITFSLADGNELYAKKAIENGLNIAVVFRTKNLPSHYMGLKVVNGDTTDLRFLDPIGVVVGLKAKGKAKQDKTGFVKDIPVL